MKLVIDILEDKISAAMAAAAGRSDCAAIVRPSTDPKFGDYQANGVMALAKKMKTNPQKLAVQVVNNLDVSDICEQPEVAGPGFINLRLKSDFIADSMLEINADNQNRLGIDKTPQSKNIVVDFSAPNIAKQMHVGHLRSTIIGDCICRMLEFQGHKVIRQNHIGDWGTQFGMLIALLRIKEREMWARFESATPPYKDSVKAPLHIEDLEAFYREAKSCFDAGGDFVNEARKMVAGLHSGDGKYLSYWKLIVDESREHYQTIYDTLGVNLSREHERGESTYNDSLPVVVIELQKKGITVKSDGAVCVFPEGFKNKEGEPQPFIIQKSDGAYLYATTDLAAIRYRINELKADKIVYVTDSRQKLHFEMLFAVARMAKWVGDDIELSHVMFGSVLGEDGTPLKTRSGENVKLKELLDEAVEKARVVVEGKNPELDEKRKAEISKAVGIGAVKYADYSNNRTSDYVFSFDKMLAMDGNTAPYMQYAYARIKSIERKAQTKDVDIAAELKGLEKLNLTEPAELDLAKYLIRYGEAIEAAVSDYRPNYLTSYLYELAQKFSVFYTNCPVLQAPKDKRPTRLMLCDLTAETIKHGLSTLLGIEVVEQM
jgi:arginyl-tRNA synthetase